MPGAPPPPLAGRPWGKTSDGALTLPALHRRRGFLVCPVPGAHLNVQHPCCTQHIHPHRSCRACMPRLLETQIGPAARPWAKLPIFGYRRSATFRSTLTSAVDARSRRGGHRKTSSSAAGRGGRGFVARGSQKIFGCRHGRIVTRAHCFSCQEYTCHGRSGLPAGTPTGRQRAGAPGGPSGVLGPARTPQGGPQTAEDISRTAQEAS